MHPYKKSLLQTPYRQIDISDLDLAGESVRIAFRPAITVRNEISPAANILANTIQLEPGMRVVHFGFNEGALSVFLARQIRNGELWLVDTSFIAYELAERTLQESRASGNFLWQVHLPPEHDGSIDAVIIELPKGRKVVQRWLLMAFQTLRMGGRLYLAGSNRGGIQSVLKDAKSLFGVGTILGYKKGNRAAVFIKDDKSPDLPDWASVPGIAPNTWHELEGNVRGKPIHLFTLPGVFAYDQIDPGSALLLEHIRFPSGGRVLDLGCGNGLVGILASSEASWVDMVDDNLLAIAAAKHNLLELNIHNAHATAGDVTSPFGDQKYQIVGANPPFHTGHGVNYAVAAAFIEETYEVLATGGEFWLVANRFIRYNPILQKVYKRVEVVCADSRYQVFCASK